MSRELVIEVIYPQPPELVWRALTDPTVLKEWLMDNDFQPVAGARCQFRMKPQPGFSGVIQCEVLQVEKPRLLVYTWDGGGPFGKTTLSWTLEPLPNGTRLTLEHRGFRGFRPFLLSLMMNSGWKKKLTQIVPEILGRMQTAAEAARQ